MPLKKTLLVYTAILGLFLAGVAGIMRAGSQLEPLKGADVTRPVSDAPFRAASPFEGLPPRSVSGNTIHPLGLFLAQIILILVSARLFASLFKALGQPGVMGEITAGLFLGPSLLGGFFPDYLEAVFPQASLGNLKILSHFGVIVFMFLTGMEIDTAHLKKHAHSAVLISQAGILVPFFLGTALAYFLYEAYAPEGISFSAFSLFMGIAMSITAFPVLAKILREKKLAGTPLGTTVLGCAAADDATAWTLLAGIMAVVRAESPIIFLKTAVLAFLFVLGMLRVVKPVLRKYLSAKASAGKNFLPEILLLILTSSFITEGIGIHALFGAFLAGTLIPADAVREKIRSKAGFLSHLLLPLFFALSGLKTQTGLIQYSGEWVVCGVIIAVAVLGKFGGTAAAAKVSGMSTQNALITGALMNTRGLMELVVLNIGLELGVISPVIFTMMVIMALVTTLMTSPLVDLFSRGARVR